MMNSSQFVANTSHSTILIVDDNPINLKLIATYLQKLKFKIRLAQDGEDTLQQLDKFEIDLILLDITMPGIDGFEVCQRVQAHPVWHQIPVIFMSALNETTYKIRGLDMGAVDYITKPVHLPEVYARVNTHLTIRRLQKDLENQNQRLEAEVERRTHDLRETRLQIVRSLGRAAEYRDNETGMHVVRMSKCAALVAQAMGLSEDECNLILNVAPMHDVGKIGIPDAVLLKPGKLDPDEWEIMKNHTLIGEEILSGNESKLLKAAALLARTHHERWDGKGYPDGLQGENIPLISRITALCDVFDALLSERPYKAPWSIERTTAYIVDNKGKHFDPQIVDYFMANLSDLLAIRAQYAD